MSTRISEDFNIAPMIVPVSLATTNVTGKYMKAGRKNTVICNTAALGTILGTETAIFQVYKATDFMGTGVVIDTGRTVTITAATLAQELTILVDTITNGKYFTLHGNTYEKQAAYSLADKHFSTNDELVTLINAVDSDLYAWAVDGTHTGVLAREPGRVDLTAGSIANWEAAKLIPSTVSAIATIEFKDVDLGSIAGVPYTHFAVKCTTNATIVVSATAIIEPSGYQPDPHFGRYVL